MYISQGTYAAYAIWSFVCGILCGMLYDVFRILRIASSPQNQREGTECGTEKRGIGNVLRRQYDRIFTVLVFLEDILFSLTTACVFAVVTYQTNYGRFRWFALAALVAGFALYYFTAGRIVIGAAGWIIRTVRRLFRLLAAVTVIPLCRLLVWAGGKAGGVFFDALGKARTARRLKKMLRNADGAFGFASAVPEMKKQKSEKRKNGGSGESSGTGKERSFK